MEFVNFLKNPQQYTDLGAKIPKGAILTGNQNSIYFIVHLQSLNLLTIFKLLSLTNEYNDGYCRSPRNG